MKNQIMRPVTRTDVDAARAVSVWDLGNRVLYDLCQNHPRHRVADEIVAKVWLIGRSYAASIERRRITDQHGDDFYEATVAPAMPTVVHDLPGGEPRLSQLAVGIDATLVAGRVTVRDGAHTGEFPGRLLRRSSR